ncbi:MAG: DUF4184 family protein [Terracidiphilus sp.]
MQAFWGARSAGQILRLAVYEQNCPAARTAGWKSRTPNASKGIKPGAIATAPWAIIGRVPFTLAHAAAAYPLRRTRLVLSALIIGTFTPDLEFFLRFAPRGPFSHTPRGLFLFCLPVGFVVYWLFHAVVKEPSAALLPRAARERVPADPYPLSLRQPLQFALVLASILVGALTHLLWDAFTHADHWPARHWPFLLQAVTLPLLGVVHVHTLLQYASSVFGCLAVFFWFRHWARTAPIQRVPAGNTVPPAQVRIARIAVPAIALVGAAIRFQIGTDLARTHRGVEFWLGEFVVTAISLVWLELMAWGLTLPLPAVHDNSRQAADSD